MRAAWGLLWLRVAKLCIACKQTALNTTQLKSLSEVSSRARVERLMA